MRFEFHCNCVCKVSVSQKAGLAVFQIYWFGACLLATQSNCKEKKETKPQTVGLFGYHCKLSVACRCFVFKMQRKTHDSMIKSHWCHSLSAVSLLCQCKHSEQRGAPFYQIWNIAKKLRGCSLRKILFGQPLTHPLSLSLSLFVQSNLHI